jgi:hypothetical protein
MRRSNSAGGAISSAINAAIKVLLISTFVTDPDVFIGLPPTNTVYRFLFHVEQFPDVLAFENRCWQSTLRIQFGLAYTVTESSVFRSWNGPLVVVTAAVRQSASP